MGNFFFEFTLKMFQVLVFFFSCVIFGTNGLAEDKSVVQSAAVFKSKSDMSPDFNEAKEELLAVARVRERAKEQQVYKDVRNALKIAEEGFLAEERAIAMRLRNEELRRESREMAFKAAIKKAFQQRSSPSNSSRILYGGSNVQLSERELHFRKAISEAVKKDKLLGI